jgi:hypothetical protein
MEESSISIENISKFPGNEKCIDCNNQNPGWISFPFSLFICAKCAKNHKQLKFSVNSLELGDFTEHEINLLNIGGNKNFLDIINEYKIPLEEPLFKYKTIIAAYYKILLEKKANKIEKKINEEELKKIIDLRPSYEEGKKENTENLDFLNIKTNNEINNDNNNKSELSKDVNFAINKIGSWMNFLGNKIKDTAEATINYAGLTEEAKNAKEYLINNFNKINEKEIVKNTKNKISAVSNKTEEFINEKTTQISETNLVKNIITNVNLGYSNLKEQTGNLINKVKNKSEIKKIEEEKKEEKKENEEKKEEFDISTEIKKDF